STQDTVAENARLSGQQVKQAEATRVTNKLNPRSHRTSSISKSFFKVPSAFHDHPESRSVMMSQGMNRM
ncbi:MAG: hypothetical protein OSB45_04770, partial [Pseudomonadales bacterium]|nr:hypothetical protein [Pseudomonadales bacterium]